MLKTNISKNNLWIGWYDPVSYFEIMQYVPVLGKKEFISVYQDVNYYFRNEENKMLFDQNPEKFLPQYGWYCATAVSEWATAPIDPHTFLVQNDKLYLFYNDLWWNNTIRDWNSNSINRKNSADELRKQNKVINTWWWIVYSTLGLWFKNIFS